MTEKLKNSGGNEENSPFDVLAEIANPNDNADTEEIAKEKSGFDLPLEERFNISPREYPIFARQAGLRQNENTGKWTAETLSIDETLGRMVGATAELVAIASGETGGEPVDHIIYLDKSARPVSWLVDEFWQDFTDEPEPERSFLAIDRRVWLRDYMGLELKGNEYVIEENGELRLADSGVVDRNFSKIPRETLARIRALYIPGGIQSEDPREIFATPTVLDGKNLLIVDEVERSGSTLYIAKKLLKAAIPKLKSVKKHVFWSDNEEKLDNGETQMGKTPVWYPEDHNDWRGRGVKDINPAYYEEMYRNNPTPDNRARRYGAIVLGEPLVSPEEEPGQPSWHLRAEIHKMHEDYEKGRILPNTGRYSPEKLIETMEDWGVEFMPDNLSKNNPHAYFSLARQRDVLARKKYKYS